MTNYTTEIIEIIQELKKKITDSSNMVWTKYGTGKEFRDDLDTYLVKLQAGDIRCLENLQLLFLPTASLQEHSISNGWSDEYIELSNKFDRLLDKKKNHS